MKIMANSENSPAWVSIAVSTSPEVAAFLDRLVSTGLFGQTREAVADTLLREKLRELMSRGELRETK